MTQLAEVRAPLVSRSIHTDSVIKPQKTRSAVTLHPLTVLGLAVTLGLATGMVELVMHVVRRQFINPVVIWSAPVKRRSLLDGARIESFDLWRLRLARGGRCRPLAFAQGQCRRRVSASSSSRRSPCMLTFRGLTLFACSVLPSAGFLPAHHLAAQGAQRARPDRAPRLARACSGGRASLVPWIRPRETRPGAAGSRTRRAPNVLFIVLDTVRAESLSAYGYSRDTSPNLTKLAQRGVRFDQARSCAAWTLPSHASMFTGRWPYELSTHPDHPLDSTYPTLAEVLRDHGYATAGFVGNTYFCNRWFGLDRGFLHYEDVAVCLVEIIRSSDMGRALISNVAPSIFTRDRPYAYFNRKDAATVNHDMLSWLDGQPKGRPYLRIPQLLRCPRPVYRSRGRPAALRPQARDRSRKWPLFATGSMSTRPRSPAGCFRWRSTVTTTESPTWTINSAGSSRHSTPEGSSTTP